MDEVNEQTVMDAKIQDDPAAQTADKFPQRRKFIDPFQKNFVVDDIFDPAEKFETVSRTKNLDWLLREAGGGEQFPVVEGKFETVKQPVAAPPKPS